MLCIPLERTWYRLQVLLAFTVIVTAGAVCLTADLLLFHIILRGKGLSTYEYILAAKDAFAAASSEEPPGRLADLCRRLPLCDSCMALRSTQRRPRRAGVSICRAIGTTLEAGQRARARRANARKIAPLPRPDDTDSWTSAAVPAAGGADAAVAPEQDEDVQVQESSPVDAPVQPYGKHACEEALGLRPAAAAAAEENVYVVAVDDQL